MEIIFTIDKQRFKYRTSALIIENNHILLQPGILIEKLLSENKIFEHIINHE